MGEDDPVNPFRPPEWAALDFLQELADTGMQLKQLHEVRKLIAETVLEDKAYYAGMDIPVCRPKDPRIIDQNEKKLKRTVLPNSIAFENLAMYCYRLPRPVNPFNCPTSVMADFIRTIYISGRFGKRTSKSATTYSLSNSAKSTVGTLDAYHCFRWENGKGKGLADSDEVRRVLRAEEAVTRNLLFLPGFDEKEKKLVLDATPDYKYYKYVLSAADPSDFWRERVVFEILEDTFDDDEFSENMDLSEAAAILGVTPEMVYSNFCKLVLPVKTLPKTFTEQQECGAADGKADDIDAFWSEYHVHQTLESVRDRQMSLATGAFEIGARYSQFKKKVGRIREKEQRRRGAAQAAPRQSALEKQVQKESRETAGLSDYERNRLKNIQERLAMFQKLGFNDLKDKLTGSKEGEKKEKVTTASKVEARERSRRIQEKGAKGGKNTILSDIGATMGEQNEIQNKAVPCLSFHFHKL